MGRLVYSMLVSLDGYVAGDEESIDWHVITEEWHRFMGDEADRTDAMLFGRRMWRLMDEFWPYAEDDESQPDYIRDYSRIWKAKPKYVASASLPEVRWGAQLLRSTDEIAALKERTPGTIGFGGPDLAASLAERDLVDEFALSVQPVVLGWGKPYWPKRRLDLELLENRRFDSGVVYLRYGRRSQ